MTTKFVLGTANFGLSYGIANNRMLSEREAFAILEKAVDAGVRSVDTAQNYGEAEKVLGRFFRSHGKLLDVVTKLPDAEYVSSGDVKRQIKKSLDVLGIERIDMILLHSFASFERCSAVLLPSLEAAVLDGLIGGYGLSVYHPEEAERANATCRQAGFNIGAVQFPLNVFDQRFLKGGLLQRLRASGVKLYARSVFLQGLFFMNSASLKGHLKQTASKITELAELAETRETSIETLALLFALSSGVDYVVLGVDSAVQLEKNAALMHSDSMHLMAGLKDRFETLQVADENIILPYNWGNDIGKARSGTTNDKSPMD